MAFATAGGSVIGGLPQGGGAFEEVRALVSILNLTEFKTGKVKLGKNERYTRTSPKRQEFARFARLYLEKEVNKYNAGWDTLLDQFMKNCEQYVSGTLTRRHYMDDDLKHYAWWDLKYTSNISASTNHPDLMKQYINDIESMYSFLARAYKNSDIEIASSDEEWAILAANLGEFLQYQIDLELD